LGALLINARTVQITGRNLQHVLKQQDEMEKHLQVMLQENEFQRLLVERKTIAVSKKYAMQVKVLQSVAFLSQQPFGKVISDSALLQSIGDKAMTAMAEEGALALLKLELKKEAFHSRG